MTLVLGKWDTNIYRYILAIVKLFTNFSDNYLRTTFVHTALDERLSPESVEWCCCSQMVIYKMIIGDGLILE